jgi:hypothetical protein
VTERDQPPRYFIDSRLEPSETGRYSLYSNHRDAHSEYRTMEP